MFILTTVDSACGGSSLCRLACLAVEESVSAGALVQAIAPLRSHALLILVLNALANGNYVAAKAMAMVGIRMRGLPIISRLFAGLYSAIRNNDRDAITLALIKLFYYHI
ncbi:hypothetical protein [Vulcanisaeta sp. JCM 16159]|uniref:hypothetical protein n=1 Tax=Vulcanisaeta sp. JCM 16159 TaxID=1295371 RepID=UPI0006D0C3D0|nr:hypothetical protein [Vulcanisaeta sp. JCM 16159]